MREDSAESRRIRLRDYECISAGEEAIKIISCSTSEGQTLYWKAFWKAYIAKMNELKKERKNGDG